MTGPTPTPSPAATPAPAPAAQPAPAPSPAPANDRPEWIPEKFWDPEAKSAKVEDLAKSYGELSSKFGKGKEAYEAERLAKRPEAADKYEIAVEGFDKEVLDKSPLTASLKETAFELGLSPEEAQGFAGKVFSAILKDLPDPVKEKEQLGQNADARLTALDDYINANFTDEAERKAFEHIGRTAAGVKALEKLIAAAQGKPVGEQPREGAPSPTPARKSKKEIDAMMQDPRYWHSSKRDEAFVKEVEDWFKGE